MPQHCAGRSRYCGPEGRHPEGTAICLSRRHRLLRQRPLLLLRLPLPLPLSPHHVRPPSQRARLCLHASLRKRRAWSCMRDTACRLGPARSRPLRSARPVAPSLPASPLVPLAALQQTHAFREAVTGQGLRRAVSGIAVHRLVVSGRARWAVRPTQGHPLAAALASAPSCPAPSSWLAGAAAQDGSRGYFSIVFSHRTNLSSRHHLSSTYIVLLPDVDPAPVLSHAELLLLGHALHL